MNEIQNPRRVYEVGQTITIDGVRIHLHAVRGDRVFVELSRCHDNRTRQRAMERLDRTWRTLRMRPGLVEEFSRVVPQLYDAAGRKPVPPRSCYELVRTGMLSEQDSGRTRGGNDCAAVIARVAVAAHPELRRMLALRPLVGIDDGEIVDAARIRGLV